MLVPNVRGCRLAGRWQKQLLVVSALLSSSAWVVGCSGTRSTQGDAGVDVQRGSSGGAGGTAGAGSGGGDSGGSTATCGNGAGGSATGGRVGGTGGVATGGRVGAGTGGIIGAGGAGMGGAASGGRGSGGSSPPDGSVDGPADGADSVCTGLAQLSLGGVLWRYQPTGTNTWVERAPTAGTYSRLTITLTNGTTTTFERHPTVKLTTVNSDATFNPASVTFFAVLAGQSVPVDWYVAFGGALASGTVIGFRAELAADQGRVQCPGASALDFSVTLL